MIADAGRHICGREDSMHAGHRFRACDVYRKDFCVCMRRANERRLERAREPDIIDELTLSANEVWVLDPFDARPDGTVSHGTHTRRSARI